MAVSPWAQIRQGAQPDTPPPDIGPWAPMPDVPAPVEGMAKPARVVEDPIASNIEYHQAQAQKYRNALANPWGTPNNHPGKLGKVAHIFSEVGNIAGNIVAPNVMANIPGTQLYNESKQAGNTAALDKELGEKATQEEQGATAGHLRAETEQIPANAESTRTYQGAETRHANAQAVGEEQLNAMGAPLKNLYDHLVSQDVAAGKDPSQNPDITRVGDAIQYLQKQTAPKSLESKGGTWKGQQAFGNFHPDTGKYTDPHTGEEMVGFKPNEPASQMIPFMYNPQTNAPFRPSAGAPLPQGTMSLTQLGQGNEKDVQETQKSIGEVKSLSGVTQMMSQLARDNTGPSDFGIIMSFTGAVKPENVGKLRWQKAEQDYIEGLRSSYGDLEAWKNKIGSGQRLTDQEKQQMIHAVQVVQNAKAQEAGLQRNGNDWYAKGADGQWHLQ